MLQRLLTTCLMLAVTLPFCVAGILATYWLLLLVLGIGPHEPSMVFLVLFVALVPAGILGFAMIGYGLLLSVLRISRLEPWFDRNSPKGKPSAIDAPLLWVRSLVHRLLRKPDQFKR